MDYAQERLNRPWRVVVEANSSLLESFGSEEQAISYARGANERAVTGGYNVKYIVVPHGEKAI